MSVLLLELHSDVTLEFHSDIRKLLMANQSMDRSKSMLLSYDACKMEADILCKQLAKQHKDILDLVDKLEYTTQQLEDAEAVIPIKVFAKEQQGRGGTSIWPFYVWELIIEQLINGTPPSSVNSSSV